MKREVIAQTATCYYDKKNKVYIVGSPLLEICQGIAKTEKEARAIFEDLLKEMYIKYLEGKTVGQYGRRGRPAKGGIALNAQVRPGTKEIVAHLANDLGISQGEAVDVMAANWKASQPAILHNNKLYSAGKKV